MKGGLIEDLRYQRLSFGASDLHSSFKKILSRQNECPTAFLVCPTEMIGYMSLIKKIVFADLQSVLKQYFNPQIDSLLTSYFKYDLETNNR